MIYGCMDRSFRRPYLACMALFAIVMTLAELFADGGLGVESCVIAAMDVIAIIVLYHRVSFGALALVAISAATLLYPYKSYPPLLWGLFLAFVLMGYYRRYVPLTICLAVEAIAGVVSLKYAPATGWTAAGMASFLGVCVFLAIAGVAVRRHMQIDDHAISEKYAGRIHMKNQIFRNNRHFASELHDATSRGLALIVLNSELCSNEGMPSKDSSRVDAIKTVALETLSRTRAIVDELMDCKGIQTEKRCSVGDLENMALLWTSSLEEYGFEGQFSFTVDKDVAVTDEIPWESWSLIDQIFTNILSHQSLGIKKYRMDVHVDPKEILVYQTNHACRDAMEDVRCWSGLKLHKSMIDDIGGSMRYSAKNGRWTIWASIPTNPAS